MIDGVVVGGGPAGLAASLALTARGVEHVVLERGRVGESWRSQRWDSFRLNTPGWANELLKLSGDDFATADEVVGRLERMADACPVRERSPVSRLTSVPVGFSLQAGDEVLLARSVVVATGDQNLARIPALADALPGHLVQNDALSYRRPAQLPPGSVLVVGSGQSGCQIAEDLVAGGRRVLLATSPAGRVPWRYRGRPTGEWLLEAGFFDQRAADLPDPALMRVANPVFAGGRNLSLQGLARSGVQLLGRLIGADGERLTFDDTAAANVAAGDASAARVRAMADEIIQRRGLDAPPAEPDETGAAFDLDPPTVIDLAAEAITAVVWCTGVTGDFAWLDPGLVDAARRPRRTGAAGALPGIWYLGLRWLTRRGSDTFHGIPQDATAVADAVQARLATLGGMARARDAGVR